MTDAERRLWSAIRMKQIEGVRFYRQKPVGDYIVDFYCPKAKLVIEVDGGQHFSGEQLENDKNRDAYLLSLGLKVLRFNNNEVLKNLEGVVEVILENLGEGK
jgi:very-short-patch-repair endonuclease